MITVHPTTNGASDYYAYDHDISTSIPLMKLSELKQRTSNPTPMVYRVVTHPHLTHPDFKPAAYGGVHQGVLYIFDSDAKEISRQIKDTIDYETIQLTEQNDNYGPEIPSHFLDYTCPSAKELRNRDNPAVQRILNRGTNK